MKLPAARSVSNIDDDMFLTKEQTNEHETHFAKAILFGRFFFWYCLKMFSTYAKYIHVCVVMYT